MILSQLKTFQKRKINKGAEEIAQQLKAHATLTEDLSWAPKSRYQETHTQLYLQFQGSNTPYGLCGYCTHACTYPHTKTYTYAHANKMNLHKD